MDIEYIFEGWTWAYVYMTSFMLSLSYAAMFYTEQLTIKIVNWFLLRSFAVISREWCFVFPPNEKTKLEDVHRKMRFLFCVLAVLLRWTGGKEWGYTLGQCAVRVAFAFAAVDLALVACVTFLEAFIRTGHYLALNLGWTPEPVSWWDYGVANSDASNTPVSTRNSALSRNMEQQQRATLTATPEVSRPITISYAGYGNSFRQSPAKTHMANLLRSARLTNTIFPMTPATAADISLLRDLNCDVGDNIPGTPPTPAAHESQNSAGRMANASQALNDNKTSTSSLSGSTSSTDWTSAGNPKEARRSFT